MVHLLYYPGICIDKISSLALGVKHSSDPLSLIPVAKKEGKIMILIV